MSHRSNSTIEELWANWLSAVPERIRDEDGIKAQFGAAAAVILFLQDNNPGSQFTFVPTEVGSWEDTQIGIDGYFVDRATNAHYAVDFSLEGALSPKGHKAGNQYLVHLSRDWFSVRADGIWELRRECLTALVRSFRHALAAGPVPWKVTHRGH